MCDCIHTPHSLDASKSARFLNTTPLLLLYTLAALSAGVLYQSKEEVFKARDELHERTGYKLVVKESNKAQIILACSLRTSASVEPTLICPMQLRVNYLKTTGMWKVSPNADFDHVCCLENLPPPTKKVIAIAKDLIPIFSTEPEKKPSGPALAKGIKAREGKIISVTSAFRALEQSKQMCYGTEEEGYQKLHSYLEQLTAANPKGHFKYCSFFSCVNCLGNILRNNCRNNYRT